MDFPGLHSADDVDTRAITRRLREDGSLIGVLSTDQSLKDGELLEMAKKWKIVGMLSFL
jgi:carbamoyl-phosphate synthase small subunit